jgi:hypothetical protein
MSCQNANKEEHKNNLVLTGCCKILCPLTPALAHALQEQLEHRLVASADSGFETRCPPVSAKCNSPERTEPGGLCFRWGFGVLAGA